MATRAAIRIGTSGWIYRHWKGLFYPEGLPQKLWLEHYMRHFDTVEVNFSFYRMPAEAAFERWRRLAPAGFRYAVKGSRFISHVKRLKDPQESVERFIERAVRLGPHLGPVLWQLPPQLERDDGRLSAFLAALPPSSRHTIEFRHPSWLQDQVFEMLTQAGVALCIPDRPQLAKELRLTAPWTYIRFHHGGGEGNYREQDLARWADLLDGYREQGIEVWAYFNNDWNGYAIDNALALAQRLGVKQATELRPLGAS